MRATTANAIKALLRADSSVTPAERARVITSMEASTERLGEDEVFTLAHAAEMLSLSRVTLWRMCMAGKLEFVRRGKKIFLAATTVEKLRGIAA